LNFRFSKQGDFPPGDWQFNIGGLDTLILLPLRSRARAIARCRSLLHARLEVAWEPRLA
jgi:hypothetical protein